MKRSSSPFQLESGWPRLALRHELTLGDGEAEFMKTSSLGTGHNIFGNAGLNSSIRKDTIFISEMFFSTSGTKPLITNGTKGCSQSLTLIIF